MPSESSRERSRRARYLYYADVACSITSAGMAGAIATSDHLVLADPSLRVSAVALFVFLAAGGIRACVDDWIRAQGYSEFDIDYGRLEYPDSDGLPSDGGVDDEA